MGRDFEITSYFPHLPLTPKLIRRLFDGLAEAGLRVGARDSDRYPVLDWLGPTGRGGMRVTGADVEEILRGRHGALPAGYGVVPLLGRAPGFAALAAGFMQFSVHSQTQPELDGLHLRFDDALFRMDSPKPESDSSGPGWRTLLTWYGIICDALRVAYGYGDWEDLFLQSVVPPSRRDVLSGTVQRLFRLNCFGPGLVARIGKSRLLAAPADAVVALRYGGVLIGGKLSYAAPNEPLFRSTEEHLGMRN
ncbi:MAG: hypothetical protein ACYDCQ_04740 [Dehalococcoidia bacterium]